MTGGIWSLGLDTPLVDVPAAVVVTAAIVAHFFLVVMIFLLSLRLVTNMDPVSLARHFALSIEGSDASEWGVVRVYPTSDDTEPYRIKINSNRTNFGLRDPLMPIHELILSANSQRYGQLISVLAERITRAYRLQWTMQFPDADQWGMLSSISLRGKVHRRLFGRREAEYRPMSDRLQLVMLILHYLRRIHRNRELEIWPDVRRQSVQFVLARLMTVLADGTREADEARRREVERILIYCVDVALGVSADYEAMGATEKPKAHGQGEGLRGLLVATTILYGSGYRTAALHAATAIGWIRGREDSPLSPERVPEIDYALAEPRLRLASEINTAALPPYSTINPWKDLAAPYLDRSRGPHAAKMPPG